MAGHGDTIKEKMGDEFVILKPRNENEFNFYKMLSDAPNKLQQYVKKIQYPFIDDWPEVVQTSTIANNFKTFREHTPYHKNYDKKDGYLLLQDLTGDPKYDYDVYDLKLGRRNFDSQVALKHFYKIGGVLPDHYCPTVKWKNPETTPPPFECDTQINKVEKQMTKIKGDMLKYGIKVAGKVSIRNGKASKQEKMSLVEFRRLGLGNLQNRDGTKNAKNGIYKTLEENAKAMLAAWDKIAIYGFHAVGMSVLIVVKKDKKGNSVGFRCKFIDFAHVEVCSLIPSVDALYKSKIYKDLLPDRGYKKTKDFYEISYKSLIDMLHLEIGYMLHKQYKINKWYPVLDHLCTVLKDDGREPCPYGNIDKLDQIILNFFMISGILGHPLKNSYRDPKDTGLRLTEDGKLAEPPRGNAGWREFWKAKTNKQRGYSGRRDDFGDGWVVDEGVHHGLYNLVLIGENKRCYQGPGGFCFAKVGDRSFDYPVGPSRQIIRKKVRDEEEKERAARKEAQAKKSGFQLQLKMVNLKF